MILPLQEQVTSVMLSADLKEFGMPQATEAGSCYHIKLSDGNWRLMLLGEQEDGPESTPFTWARAFNVSELAAMIPKKTNLPQSTTLGRWYRMAVLNIDRNDVSQVWTVAFIQPNSRDIFKSFADKNLAEAMGEMLAWLLENELITTTI